MTSPQDRDPFLIQVKDQLDQAVETLPPEVVARLRRARHDALHSQPTRIPWWWPISGLATAGVALFMAALWWEAPRDPLPNDPPQLVEDVEVLMAADQLDLYEDLEFYGWLAEHDRAS